MDLRLLLLLNIQHDSCRNYFVKSTIARAEQTYDRPFTVSVHKTTLISSKSDKVFYDFFGSSFVIVQVMQALWRVRHFLINVHFKHFPFPFQVIKDILLVLRIMIRMSYAHTQCTKNDDNITLFITAPWFLHKQLF